MLIKNKMKRRKKRLLNTEGIQHIPPLTWRGDVLPLDKMAQR